MTYPPDHDAPEEIRWQGKYIVAKQRGRWEYASRARNMRAAAIIAIDTSDSEAHVLLVEQYRVPLGRRCIEIPAGLVGDDAGSEDESAVTAAHRELEPRNDGVVAGPARHLLAIGQGEVVPDAHETRVAAEAPGNPIGLVLAKTFG